MTWILFSHGVVVRPDDTIVHGTGKITYRIVSLSLSHVQSADSEGEEEYEGAAADEAPPMYDP